jgi:hypothetical protein
MPFEVIETKEHTDDGHGRNYSAKHTVTTTYKHPKDLLFKHVHEDGKDCEDVYRFETVTIGDTVIGYKYDWGNYFIVEYIQIIEEERKSCVQQEYGAVDPLKRSEEHKQEGRDIIKQLAADFDMSPIDFVTQCASTFNIKLDLMKLYG